MDANAKEKNALHILLQAGLSKTPQRIAVINILADVSAPVTINSIRQALKLAIKVDRVTIYRILSLFKEHGIIREITSNGGVSYFELASIGNPVHPHFICRKCEKLSCLDPLTFSQAIQWISPMKDYSIDHIEINISGICAGCLNATQLQKILGK